MVQKPKEGKRNPWKQGKSKQLVFVGVICCHSFLFAGLRISLMVYFFDEICLGELQAVPYCQILRCLWGSGRRQAGEAPENRGRSMSCQEIWAFILNLQANDRSTFWKNKFNNILESKLEWAVTEVRRPLRRHQHNQCED